MFARQVFARRFATATGTPKRESTFMRVWGKEYAAYPIIFFTSCVVIFGTVKSIHALTSPDLHFNKDERKSIDFLENDRSQKPIDRWAESTFHKGPEFIRNRSPYKHYENIKPESE